MKILAETLRRDGWKAKAHADDTISVCIRRRKYTIAKQGEVYVLKRGGHVVATCLWLGELFLAMRMRKAGME